MAALTDCPRASGACGTRAGLGQAAPDVSWEGSPPSSMVFCPVILRNFQFLDEQGEKMAFNDSGMWDINQETITAMMFQAAAFQMDEFS